MSCFRKIFFVGLLWWPSLPGWRPKPGPSRHLGAPPVGRARRTLAPPFGSGDRCSAITKNPQKNKKLKLYLAIRERAKSERLTPPELGDRFWRSWGRVLIHFEAWSSGGGSGCSDCSDAQSRSFIMLEKKSILPNQRRSHWNLTFTSQRTPEASPICAQGPQTRDLEPPRSSLE